MNKITNIEIASQVFPIDEQAFEVLSSYLAKIRQQLSDDDSASEIINDIELRIAELLYGFSQNQGAINLLQVEEVIDQVGFIDSEENETDTDATRQSFLDPENKIVGGVCAGLAVRFQVPAFVLRLIFLLLTPIFGAGVILYCIFWLTLDNNTNRNQALAALGKPRTARELALYEDIKPESPVSDFFHTLQRIIFLPFSLIAILLSVIGKHFIKRRGFYVSIVKNILAAGLIFFASSILMGLWYFTKANVFPSFINFIIGSSVIYLIVMVVAYFAKSVYLSRPRFEIPRELKLGALVPVSVLGLAIFFFANATFYQGQETISRSYLLSDDILTLEFADASSFSGGVINDHPRIQVRSKPPGDNTVSVTIDYHASGRSNEKAMENIQNISYEYQLENNTLVLSDHFGLKEGSLSRSHWVSVFVELPQGVFLNSPRSLRIRERQGTYDYSLPFGTSSGGTYLTSGLFLHEFHEPYRNRLSNNEAEVLRDKFCVEFFIGQPWSCDQNIRVATRYNSRFDHAFEDDRETIEQLRQFMMTNRSVFVSNLLEVNALIDGLSIDFSGASTMQEYVNHLIDVKSI